MSFLDTLGQPNNQEGGFIGTLGNLPNPNEQKPVNSIKDVSLSGLGRDAGNLVSKFPGQELGKAVGSSLYDFGSAANKAVHGDFKGALNTITAPPDPNIKPEKVIGDTINAVALPASLAIGGGTGATALSRVGNAALKYGTAGAVQGGASSMAKGESVGNVVKKTAIGGVVGAVGGATGQGLAEGVSAYKASKADFIDKMITPPTEKGKVGLNAIKSGKVVEGKGITGKRDFSEALPNFDKIKESVSQVPGIAENNTHLQNLNAIHENIASTAENLKGQLGAETSSFTPKEFNKYMDSIKSKLAESPMIVGDSEKTATKIVSKFNNLVESNGYTPEGLLNARQQLDSWMSSQKTNVFDPATENAVSVAMREIRQGGNKFLAKLAPNVEVDALLKHQSNLYDAIEAIAPKAQKEGASYISRIIGAARAHPVGALIGATAVGAAGDTLVKKVTGL